MPAISQKRKISPLTKTLVMIRLIESPETLPELFKNLTAPQMQDLRNYLIDQIIYISGLMGEVPLSKAEILSQMEPVPNYYHKQYCREPLDACINESCMASNPSCFSKKMRTQIDVLVNIILSYLRNTNHQPA